MINKPYLLDANIFIQSAREFYSFDFGTKFWDFLIKKARQNIIFSIDKVYEELIEGDDTLKIWAQNYFYNYFLPTNNEKILNQYAMVISWAQNSPTYTDNAKNDFAEADNADAWLIATALDKDYTIVTFEKLNKNRRNKILIPNACYELNIKYCDLFTMLKQLNFKL